MYDGLYLGARGVTLLYSPQSERDRLHDMHAVASLALVREPTSLPHLGSLQAAGMLQFQLQVQGPGWHGPGSACR